MAFTYAQISSLNETEAHVYDYITKNKDRVLEESIRELANHTNVSTATVIRFCKKVGCSGFTELKYKLKESLEIEAKDEKLDQSSFVNFIEHVYTHNYSESIQKTVDLIKNADSFYILGLGPFSGFAKTMAYLFSEIGYYCYGIQDKYYLMPEVEEGHNTVVLIGYASAIKDAVVEEIEKYNKKHKRAVIIFFVFIFQIIAHIIDVKPDSQETFSFFQCQFTFLNQIFRGTTAEVMIKGNNRRYIQQLI